MRFLVVCEDNLSLSAMAEGIMWSYIKRKNYFFLVNSAGMNVSVAGERPSTLAIQTLKSHSIDISANTARQFTQRDFNESDLIVTLGKPIYDRLLQMATSEKERKKVKDISEYAEKPLPEFAHDSAEDVYRILTDACEKVIFKVIAVR